MKIKKSHIAIILGIILIIGTLAIVNKKNKSVKYETMPIKQCTITEVVEEVVSNPIEDEINLTIADDGTITVNIPNGIREMNLNLNDMDYGIDLGSENPTDITIIKEDIPFIDGKNTLIVKVVGFNGTVKEETKEIHFRPE